jgi:hypothetical protein
MTRRRDELIVHIVDHVLVPYAALTVTPDSG